jgi:hypothetical protein
MVMSVGSGAATAGRWGTATDDSGGIAMSAMVMDVRAVGHVSATAGMFDAVAGRSHPRGQGFRVLSRMARVEAEDSTDYAPRHRREVPVHVDIRTSIAS